jgi:energy-converting hydrogenase Eha subunit C
MLVVFNGIRTMVLLHNGTTQCTASRRASFGTTVMPLLDAVTTMMLLLADVALVLDHNRHSRRRMMNRAQNREVTSVRASLNNSHSFVCTATLLKKGP